MVSALLRIGLGAVVMLSALALLLAMVSGGLAVSLALSLAAYTGLFAGMFIAVAGILRLVHRRR